MNGPRDMRWNDEASRLSAIGMPSINPSVLRSSGTSAADDDLALDIAQHTEERQQEFLLALAVQPAEADDFTPMYGQLDAVEPVLPG